MIDDEALGEWVRGLSPQEAARALVALGFESHRGRRGAHRRRGVRFSVKSPRKRRDGGYETGIFVRLA